MRTNSSFIRTDSTLDRRQDLQIFFRYKLLLEKCGWWVDTDVICRSRKIPLFNEFIAREDTDRINNAVMFFAPGHPLMARCYEEAKNLGCSIRFGGTGPRLLTRLSLEYGCAHGALPHALCYPIHHTRALDVLRPSKFGFAPRTDGVGTIRAPLECDIAALRRAKDAFAPGGLTVATMGRSTPSGWLDSGV